MLQIPHASITLKNLIEQEIINPQQKKQRKLSPLIHREQLLPVILIKINWM